MSKKMEARRFSRAFKLEVVRRMEAGENIDYGDSAVNSMTLTVHKRRSRINCTVTVMELRFSR